MLISAVLLVFTQLFIRSSLQQQSNQIICYDYNGAAYPNNTQCPGSNACCGSPEQCTPDRLCAKNNTLVRAPCSQYPWVHCSPICLYGGSDGYLPRVHQCSDGSYCCDNQPACCYNHEGIVLDGTGDVVSTELPTGATSSTTASATSTSVGPIITSQSAPPTSTSSATAPPSHLPTSTTIGIAAGVSAGVLLLITLIAVIWYYRKRLRRLEAMIGGQGMPRAITPRVSRCEFDAIQQPCELNGTLMAHELNNTAMSMSPGSHFSRCSRESREGGSRS